MCKLSAIELSILTAAFEMGVNSSTATDVQKAVLAEMLTLSKELMVKWDNSKGQKLWALGAHKSLIEEPAFVTDTNGAKCVIRATLDKVNAIVVNAAIAALTTPVVVDAPNTPATTAPTVAAPAAPTVAAPQTLGNYNTKY